MRPVRTEEEILDGLLEFRFDPVFHIPDTPEREESYPSDTEPDDSEYQLPSSPSTKPDLSSPHKPIHSPRFKDAGDPYFNPLKPPGTVLPTEPVNDDATREREALEYSQKSDVSLSPSHQKTFVDVPKPRPRPLPQTIAAEYVDKFKDAEGYFAEEEKLYHDASLLLNVAQDRTTEVLSSIKTTLRQRRHTEPNDNQNLFYTALDDCLYRFQLITFEVALFTNLFVAMTLDGTFFYIILNLLFYNY